MLTHVSPASGKVERLHELKRGRVKPRSHPPALSRQSSHGRDRYTGVGLLLLGLVLSALLTACRERGPEPAKGDRAVAYIHDTDSSVPWSIHVAKIDRQDPTLQLHSVLARGTVLGLSPVGDQASSIPPSWGTPLAAVNGDFYVRENSAYAGDPRGMQIVEGELVSAPVGKDFSVFWIDGSGEPHATNVLSEFKVTFPDGSAAPLGLNEERHPGRAVLYTPTLGKATRNRGAGLELVLEKAGDGPWLPLHAGETYSARVTALKENGPTSLTPGIMVLSLSGALATNAALATGALVSISTETTPSLRGARMAIGGGSVVTRSGKTVTLAKPSNLRSAESFSIRSMFERHPRAMVGWNATHFFLAEVDGRQRGLSVGMTLEEVGAYMAKLGCETAMSLDGGGSATFWYRGRVVNSPCDGTERPVANSLVLSRKARPETP